jgi:hypothetical protein
MTQPPTSQPPTSPPSSLPQRPDALGRLLDYVVAIDELDEEYMARAKALAASIHPNPLNAPLRAAHAALLAFAHTTDKMKLLPPSDNSEQRDQTRTETMAVLTHRYLKMLGWDDTSEPLRAEDI